MAPSTRVDGNTVHIDDSTYTVAPAGAGQYAVTDEFGGKVGYFTVRGRVVSPEDFGVDGAHPVVQIGRLWAAASLFKDQDKDTGPRTVGVCRVAVHERASPADQDKARAYRAWMKKQPGCKASFFVHDPETGKGLSISIWGNRGHLAALGAATPPADTAALAEASVEIYPLVEEP